MITNDRNQQLQSRQMISCQPLYDLSLDLDQDTDLCLNIGEQFR